ncbi:MAG TPA: hypothetical protein VH370_04425, partial [Humisphaera sp.]|nr:hypothetical protein [Humisphaera sp.]
MIGVKRLRRIVWNGLAAASALVCMSAAVLWVRHNGGLGVDRYTSTQRINPTSQTVDFTSSGMGIVSTDTSIGVFFDRLHQTGPYRKSAFVESEREDVDWGASAEDQFRLIADEAFQRFGFWFHWRWTPVRQRLIIGVPFWFAVILFGVLPAIRVRQWRAARKQTNRLCSTCGYDLRASPNKCPECGTVAA